MTKEPANGCSGDVVVPQNQAGTSVKPKPPSRKEKILKAIQQGGAGDGISEATRQAVLKINGGHRKPLVYCIKEEEDEEDDPNLEDDDIAKGLLRNGNEAVRLNKQLQKAQAALVTQQNHYAKKATLTRKRNIQRLEDYVERYHEILSRRKHAMSS